MHKPERTSNTYVDSTEDLPGSGGLNGALGEQAIWAVRARDAM